MTAPVPEPVVSWRRRAVVWSLLLVSAVGVGLHFLLRDAWQAPTAVVFYALPRPLLTAFTILAALAARRLSRREFRLTVVAASACLLWTLSHDVRWSAGTGTSSVPTLRIALWNAAHLPRGVRAAAEIIRTWDADVIGVVEAGTTYELEQVEWRRELADYHVVCPRPQMLLISRGPIHDVEVKSIGRHSEVALARIEHGAEHVHVAVVDIVSHLSYGRAEPLRNLTQILEERPTAPHVVMGDFNTPPESVWFDTLRARYRSAFEVAGRGYRPTWPVPIPMLQLDFLWVRDDVTVNACRHGWTSASDHRPVIADVKIATTATRPANFPAE
ncbi:MAG TPA: endonuclease/exonuclease/phosphatase family protein [Planctomycetaceae bacterium]|nr:endonuclease/exonuclease/phosphatase family protein [Planctomycetaceae bacterium]